MNVFLTCQNADLTNANLEGAVLEGANLKVKCTGTVWAYIIGSKMFYIP